MSKLFEPLHVKVIELRMLSEALRVTTASWVTGKYGKYVPRRPYRGEAGR